MENPRSNPMPGQRLAKVLSWVSTGYNDQDYYMTDDMNDASVITSLVSESDNMHKPILDIDFPVKAIPSTTEGHFHLYLDKAISSEAYEKLLNALADAGIIEPGYLGASLARGFTAVRLPWVKKEKDND